MAILVDWAKQTVSGTPGTGTITLSTAVTGFIKLQDDTRLVDGGLVYYTITDGSNYERGIGTYTATGTTLTRTKIQAKYESGTYTENPGTGLTLTSAAIVSCSAVAATHNHRGALVYHSALQAVTTATVTTALMDSEIYDTDGFHSTSVNTGRLTIPNGSGIRKVQLTGLIDFSSSSTGYRIAWFQKNGADFEGTQIIVVPAATASNITCVGTCSPVVTCTDADYFTMCVYHTHGSNLNINSSTNSGKYHNFSLRVVE